MFAICQESWIDAVKAYCFIYPLETIEISYYLIQRDLASHPASTRRGTLYIYSEEDEIKSLVFFNAKGMMHISDHSKSLFDKVDFLKAIHHHKPTVIRGRQAQIDRVFYFLQRVLKDFYFYPMQLMALRANLAALPGQIVDAKQIDWLQHSSFLAEVEAAFRDDTLSINYLRKKIASRHYNDFYLIARAEQDIYGQVIGELSTWRHGLIGGLYVRPQQRRHNVARQLMTAAVRRYQSDGKTAILYVENNNHMAHALYRKMGFVSVAQMTDLKVKL